MSISLLLSPTSSRSIKRGRDTSSNRMGGICSFVFRSEMVTSLYPILRNVSTSCCISGPIVTPFPISIKIAGRFLVLRPLPLP